MKGLILISTVAFSLASFAASASEAPSESVCSLTHLKLVADKEGLDPAGALAKECIGKGYTAAKAFFAAWLRVPAQLGTDSKRPGLR